MQEQTSRFFPCILIVMSTLITLALICLATHRITRFLLADAFPLVAIPREWILNWLAPDVEWIKTHDGVGHWGAFGRSLRYLGECPWCMSIYVSAGVVWVTTQFASVPLPVLAWLAASSVSALLMNTDAVDEVE